MRGKANPKPDEQPRKVLIVDDDISVSEYLDVAIKSAGHQTILAYDGNGENPRELRSCTLYYPANSP